jgi:hypothetical protein
MIDIFFVIYNIENLKSKIRERFPLAKFCFIDENSKKGDYFFQAQRKSFTKFFWLIGPNHELLENFKLDYVVPEYDSIFVHSWKNDQNENAGVYLISKYYPITQKEAEFNFFINKKEFDTVASTLKKDFDRFYISTQEDYLKAQQNSTTDMFYAILDDRIIDINFKFDYVVSEWDKVYVHIFKQTDGNYGGVYLIPKYYPITRRESEYNFFIANKEIDIIASSKGFEIVFISYNEPNAENNWKILKDKFPYAKRLDKIKGIHNAHISAAKITNTSMIWIVDGDALISDNFNFDIEIPKWDRNITHVCKSKNPINDLTYGYGSIKLLPRKLLLDIDINSIDMTTSISKEFKIIDIISNITCFNTDPFNTWKSAFRECVKLSSKIISGQIDSETIERLNIWCTVGSERDFGIYSIQGANAGKAYGSLNHNNLEALRKINDWEWLTNLFNESIIK